jgi:hypothetical protein
MIEPKQKTIDGLKFQLAELPVWDALPAFHRLLRLLGPAAAGVRAAVAAGSDDDAKKKAIAALIGTLPEMLVQAPPDEVVALSKLLLKECLVFHTTDPTKSGELLPIIDNVLRGKLMTIFKLLTWSIEVNFSGFFSDLGGHVKGLAAQQGNTSKSPMPSASAGPAGG